MIHIDGSFGEGGGQILRTSLALSMCSGQGFTITDIRGKRKKPGLLRQHLTAVQAAQTVCGADVSGATMESRELTFEPGPVKPGDYQFAIGTAGSATLVLQTILPPLLIARARSHLVMKGGTHNQWAPPFHFIRDAFLPLINRMGPQCSVRLQRWGFFPAGGGEFDVTIVPATAGENREPGTGLGPLDLSERGKLVKADILAAVAQIPHDIADDEAKAITHSVRFPITSARTEEAQSIGPGNVAMLDLEFENGRAFFTGFGALGVSRKQVARQVSVPANDLMTSGAAVDGHLADQLLIPLALAGGGRFTTVDPTPHTETNIDIIKRFLPVAITMTKIKRNFWSVEITRNV